VSPLHRIKARSVFLLLLVLSTGMAVLEAVLQKSDSRYVRSIAFRVVQDANASTPQDKARAIRDYLRKHVSYEGAPFFENERPFFRASAGDTLRTGKGYCGDVSRVFICMAAQVGIRAQRINLAGDEPHTVAEAELGPSERILVDCQNPPKIPESIELDRLVVPGSKYTDYYTLNLRRLRITWLVTRVKLEMGPFTYWTENPHALKALLWGLLALSLVSARGLRALVRAVLVRRGWVHVTDDRRFVEAAAAVRMRTGAAKAPEEDDSPRAERSG